MKRYEIHNPILKGFHPDPSIIRVGEDYYLANSTFEWWPGVRLHHSRDLIHWELIEYPLNRVSQLDLRGVGPSQGIWAPDLSYCDGTYYLVYTIVRSFYCNMQDTENYLVTTNDIHGPWSEPIPLNNFGFDPSLFHDDDGRKYLVSMVTDHREPQKYVGRLVLREFDPKTNKMIGPLKDIYTADKVYLEGPHIFKRNGWYYLFAADTGTGELHGQSILRSRDIWGPYEMFQADFMERTSDSEAYSILTSRHHETIALQKSGHCDLVDTPDGDWYAVHLCGRPSKMRNPDNAGKLPGSRRYMLGRESAIQKMKWTEDDWLVLDCGGNTPQDIVPGPEVESSIETDARENRDPEKLPFVRDEFNGDVLNLDYQSQRVPMDESFLSLTERPGWLRMYGRSGISSKFAQTLIARRMTEYNMSASTLLSFEPESFKQMAGLIAMYDIDNYLYLHVSYDEDLGKCIMLLKCENKKFEYLSDYIPVQSNKDLVLKLQLKEGVAQFYYGEQEGCLVPIGPETDASFLSDEACAEGWFSGTMIGICCQDLTGERKAADFDWFEVNSENG